MGILKLHNLIEEEVVITVNKLMDNADHMCNCNKCRLDVAAIALNNLKPKYVVTSEGDLYGRINNMTQQFNTDILSAVTKAMKIVSNNPKHEE